MESLVAACGLFCSNCEKYKNQSCSGCQANEKANWCKVRSCCKANDYRSCADCEEYNDPRACNLFNNGFSRLVGWLLNSDRKACIAFIKKNGYDSFCEEMIRQERKSFVVR